MGLPWRGFGTRKLQITAAVLACSLAGAAILAVSGKSSDNTGDFTASIDPTDNRTKGPSGLPVPRFVTLKSGKVNVRRGPSSEYPVAWVYQRKGYPVEITAEFENWRRIRDVDGTEGWILQQMLSGKRLAVVASGKARHALLYDDKGQGAGLVAKLGTGVLGETEECDGNWCHFETGDFEGYIAQTQLWGVYPGEIVD
jgi:SH3-like domain-containing protein